jgi:ABC-2 type transport system permease protein
MSAFWGFTLRALRALFRNWMATLMTFGFPLFFLVVFTATARNGTAGRVTMEIAVRNMNASADHPVVKSLQELGGVRLLDTATVDPKAAVASGRYGAVLDVNPGDGRPPALFVSRGQAQLANWVAGAARSESNPGGKAGGITVMPIESENRFLAYILPGLVALACLQLGTYATAMSVLSERAQRTLRLLAFIAAPRAAMVWGEVAARLILGAVQLVVLFALLIAIAGFTPASSWLIVGPMAFAGALMMIALGALVGGTLPRQQVGIQVLTFLNLMLLFTGDVFAPVSSFMWLKPIALLNPVAYLSDALRQVMTPFEGARALPIDLAVMAAITMLAAIAAGRTFRFEAAQ